jgi:hypothetical protein
MKALPGTTPTATRVVVNSAKPPTRIRNPVTMFHRTRDAIEACLTIVFAAPSPTPRCFGKH